MARIICGDITEKERQIVGRNIQHTISIERAAP